MYDGFTLFDEYSVSWRAQFVRNLLEENGIRVIVDNTNLSILYPLLSFNARLYVKTEDLEQAMKLVAESRIDDEEKFDQLDELAESSKYETTYYEKPEDANVVTVKKKMPYAVYYFFIANYILIILQIAARIAVMNPTEYIEMFKHILPYNIIIALIHLFYLFLLKTTLQSKTAVEKQSENSDTE